jgi:phosphotransferase system  glucose/maltose/N-acetylglucosamine-specific IIC component
VVVELDRETFLATGLILLVAGFLMFLAFNPSYTSLSDRLARYETPSLNQSDYQFYTLLSTTLMPIIDMLIAIGITLLLLGVFIREKK